MRPRLMSRGKSRRWRRLLGAGASFNAAAAHEPRKAVDSYELSRAVAASMRPRLMSRGKQLRSWRKDRGGIRFNAAAAHEPRKAPRGEAGGLVFRASMRPRLMSRGKRAYASADPPTFAKLQCGRGS